MNFTDIHNKNYSKFNNIHTGNAVLYNTQNLFTDSTNTFGDYFVNIINHTILSNNLHVMSIEQQKFFEKFLEEADKYTVDDAYVLPAIYDELNIFLGSYRGDHSNGR